MKFSHAHILSCVLSEIARMEKVLGSGQRLRILDTGCGHGGLIADALLALDECFEGRGVEIYGFEVQEHGAGRQRYWDDLNETLYSRFPDSDWSDRIRVASSSEDWPFDDGFFDLVMSNQVLEHVECLEGFFAQQSRVLKPGGLAIHHFPTVESLVDPHSGVPFGHWSRSDVCRGRNLRFFSRLGIGKYENYRVRRGHSIDQFVDEFVDYLRQFTFFRTLHTVESLSKSAGFATFARYNVALARRWVDEAEDVWPYCGRNADTWFARVLSRFASVTLVCEK